LAKPQARQPLWWRTWHGTRYEFLSTIGIFGAAVTLLAHLRSVIELADWINTIVRHWVEFVHAIWFPLFRLLGFEIDKPGALLLSLIILMLGMALGVRRIAVQSPNKINEREERRYTRILNVC